MPLLHWKSDMMVEVVYWTISVFLDVVNKYWRSNV
jgi:hypothetical protein